MEFTLANGVKLPAIGFGTFLATENRGEQTILDAIEAGYRSFDTASFYGNEEEVGNALAKSGLSRDEYFLTTKAWKTEMGYENTKKALEQSLARLQVDFVDLYLIHWPKADKKDPNWEVLIQETWRAMEELYEEGKTKAIGVSNFLPHHVKAIEKVAKVAPMVNQLELHVGYMQEAAVEYCNEHNIVVQAWSPLGRRRLLEVPEIQEMAKVKKVSAAEILLGFLLAEGIAIVPKASSLERMRENLAVSADLLSEEERVQLKGLPMTGWSGEHPDWEDGEYMAPALEEAYAGIRAGHGGPFGAVVVKDGQIVGRGHNRVLLKKDPTCHGEMEAIRDACKNLKTHDLSGCKLYTTAEPCPMCLGGILWSNITEAYYGCNRQDTDGIGFRDDIFYDYLAGKSDILKLEEYQREECLELFAEFSEKNGDIEY